MAVTPVGFAELTRLCLEMGDGRAVFALEGGYDLAGLRASAAASMRALAGERLPGFEAGPAPGFERVLWALKAHHARHWPVLAAR
jgi:acetoin utilization deacetylase AcuC-like enzyme